MSTWDWIKVGVFVVWPTLIFVAAVGWSRFHKVTAPPEKRVVTVGELAQLFDDLDEFLAAQDPR